MELYDTLGLPALPLVSHALCPYVQRAAIALAEKGVAFERVVIDLDRPPEWFHTLSPLGKVPLLRVGDDAVLFESTAIVEYLEDTLPPRAAPERSDRNAPAIARGSSSARPC